MADVFEDFVSGIPVVTPIVDEPVAYSLSLSAGWGAPTGDQVWCARLGTNLLVGGKFNAGTVANSIAQINLPTGLVVGTFKGSSGNGISVGRWIRPNTTGSAVKVGSMLCNSGQSAITFCNTDLANNTASTAGLNVSAQFTSGEQVGFDGVLIIPIASWQAEGPSRAYGAGVSPTSPSLVYGCIPPTLLTAAQLTSQTGLVIEQADIGDCTFSYANRTTTLNFNFNNVTITASVTSLQFVLPSIVPRPPAGVNKYGTIIIFDNTGSNPVLGLLSLAADGTVVISKQGQAAFTGGSNSSYLRGSISWTTV